MDLLDNADDEVLEKLSSLQAVDEETKRRVFSMTEKKYEKLKKSRNDAKNDSVEGVESYTRRRWMSRALAAAAALVIVGGGAGLIKLMSRTAPPPPTTHLPEEVTEPVEPTEEESSEEPIDDEPEEVTEAPVIKTAKPDEKAPEPGEMTDEEKNAAAKLLVSRFVTLNKENAPDLETVAATLYIKDGYMTENGIDPNYADVAVELDGTVYMPRRYYRVAQPGYTLDELKEAYDGLLTDNFLNLVIGGKITSDPEGNFIDSEVVPVYVELDGVLCSDNYEPDDFDPAEAEVVAEKIYPVTDSLFIWEGVYPGVEDESSFEVVNSIVVYDKDKEGWRMGSMLHGTGGYDPEADGEYPILLGSSFDLLKGLAEAGDVSESDIEPF